MTASTPGKHKSKRPGPKRKPTGAYLVGSAVVLMVTLICIVGFSALLLRPSAAPLARVWMLNHTPDQVIIINPFDGVIEKKFLVADGLRELAFSLDYTKAYVANVVDVSNRFTVLDTRTYLDEEVVEVDGVPQGFGVFPDNRKLAVILGSKTDFMAGGFDVIDLYEQSRADPRKKKRLYRERELQLTHKIAIGDDGDRTYCIDAKSALVSVFSFNQKQRIKQIDLHGAPEEMLYPRVGGYYYISVLVHDAIYQLSKETDEVEAVYTYEKRDLTKMFDHARLRFMAVDSQAKYLFGTCYERQSIAIWQIGNKMFAEHWENIPYDPANETSYRFEREHYLPYKKLALKGGYTDRFTFVPGGQQIVVDPHDEFVFVVDDEGGFYIYDLAKLLHAVDQSTPEPRAIIELGRETEIRDMKACRPAAGSTSSSEGT